VRLAGPPSPMGGEAPPPQWFVYGTVALAQLIFSGFHIFSTIALLHSMPPSLFALMRLVIASPVVLLLASLREGHLPERKHHPRLFVLGLLGVGGSQGLAVAGLYFTDPINLAVAQPMQPILTTGLSIALGMERFSAAKSIGILVSVAGCILVVLFGDHGSGRKLATNPHANFPLGNLLLFLNCLCMSLYLILQKSILAHVPTWTVTAWVLTWGAVPMALWCAVSASLSGPQAFVRHLTHASPLSWAALAYGGVMAAGVAMMLTSYGVKHGGPTLAASLVPLQPLFSTILAVVVLHEFPMPGQYLGALAIVAGLWVVLWANRQDSMQQAQPIPRTDEAVEMPAVAGEPKASAPEHEHCGLLDEADDSDEAKGVLE